MENKIEKPLVSILSITYNHSGYIRKALDSFLMQKTTFDFEIVVADDCSTDNNQDIIREYKEKYPDIIVSILRTKNVGANNNFNDAFDKCRGKYIAICEGDDYWTDPNKLQKQVDFLESNPDYSMVCTNYYKKRDDKILEVVVPKNISYQSLLTQGNKIGTLTSMFKRVDYFDFIKEINPLQKNWLAGDLPLWLYLSTKGRIKVLDDFTGVYRVLQSSASHFQDIDKQYQFFENMISIREFFHNKYSSDNVEITQKLRIRKINLEMYKWFNKSSVKQYYKVLKQKHQLEKKYHLTDIIKLVVLATGLMFVYKLRKNLLIK